MRIQSLAPLPLFGIAVLLSSQPAPRERVGPLADGSVLLNSGWRIRPAGKQVPLDTLPMSSALSPDNRYLLVLNGGYKPPSVSVLDVVAEREVSRTPVADAWLGLTFSPGGYRVYVGGGSQSAVFEFEHRNGVLGHTRALTIPGERVFAGDVTLSPDGKMLYVASLYENSVARIDLETGQFVDRFPTGQRPYRILFHADGKSFFVSSWVDSAVIHHAADTGRILGRIPVGAHPTDMLWGEKGRLFVAAANTNRIDVLGLSEEKTWKVIETINVAMTPRQPVGMTPSALALSADRRRLYVVCSDANALAVVDVSEQQSRVLGFVPTGWYPTAARSLEDGRLVVLNGRGLRSFPNPKGPAPVRRPVPSGMGTPEPEYVARLQTGSASFIQAFDARELNVYSNTVLANSRYRDTLLDDARAGTGDPIPNRPDAPSPLRHVVYIIKENRTYDQVLGDMKEGNGDPSLVLFGEEVTPNQHKLAREFVLLDNFYVNADVSADGHNWSSAAIAPDFVQKVWPNGYARRGAHEYYWGNEPAAVPPNGYIWTKVLASGLKMRNYGYFVYNRSLPAVDGNHIDRPRDPILESITSPGYRGYDLDYPDVERAKVFLAELADFERKGVWPQFILIRLGNNHTAGTSPGRLAPRSFVADNDYALGLIVEGISKSRFWPATAIFVLEDDAQNGADHVDSHRSPAFVISPYAKRRAVDSSMYNTTSTLRTMELILGLDPMTHFDAGARPMSAVFQSEPDLRPYIAEKPRISLEQRNPELSATAARSARMDFSEADLIDDDELNDILWRALKQTDPPPPVRSYFSR